MERRTQQGRAWRAAVGVLMLYVLALQALLGGIAVTRMSLQAPGMICAGHVADPAEESDGQADPESCCGAACRLASFALAARADATAPQVIPTLAREHRWLAVQFHSPPSPAHPSARPRAPPAAV